MTFGRDGARVIVQLASTPTTSRDALVAAINDFLEGASRASRESARIATEALAPALTSANGVSLILVANLIGLLVERGADPGVAAPAFADRLVAVTSHAKRLADAAQQETHARDGGGGDDDDEDDYEAFERARMRLADLLPEESADWEVLTGLLAPALAICGASAAAREHAAACLPDLDDLAERSDTARWLRRFLRVLYNEPFVAIEPSTGMAIKGRMTGVSENFQLNVLLMDAFPRQGLFARQRVSKSVVAIARGDGPQRTNETVTGAWDLMTWRAATADGSLPQAGAPAFMEHAIWNEGMPVDIPTFEGMRAILLGPPSYARTWTSQREFLNLRAELTAVERLPKAESAALLKRMAATPRPS